MSWRCAVSHSWSVTVPRSPARPASASSGGAGEVIHFSLRLRVRDPHARVGRRALRGRGYPACGVRSALTRPIFDHLVLTYSYRWHRSSPSTSRVYVPRGVLIGTSTVTVAAGPMTISEPRLGPAAGIGAGCAVRW